MKKLMITSACGCGLLLTSCLTPLVSDTPCQLVASPVGCVESEDCSVEKPGRKSSSSSEPQPVDLANVLAMGGANNLQIELARKKVIESHLDYEDAKNQWLPSLRFGVGFNKHNGRLQSTPGQVVKANRNSLFAGGGAGLGDASLAGGAGGPSRLVMNLSLADAFFEPIIAHRQLDSTSAAECVTINNSLLSIALSYFDLVEAHGLLANARVGLKGASKMVATSTAFEAEGLESPAEVQRAKTDYSMWQQKVYDAERETAVASTDLLRQLRMDPANCLVPAEDKVVPITVIDSDIPCDELIQQGLANRPEMDQQDALVAAAQQEVCREKYRNLLPSVQAGVSGGHFGGGPSTSYDNSGGRGDLDLMAVWELRNLGYGNQNAKKKRAVQFEQAQLREEWISDQIAAEIVSAQADILSYRKQMKAARDSVASAMESYDSNASRIAQAEGRPIELLQAIHARSEALDSYTRAVSDHNRAQFRLLRAVGKPPSVCGD